MLTECELMTRLLLSSGVPMDAIIPENEATTTRENMILATLQINRKNRFKGIDRVLLVTSVTHMRRSLAVAKAFLPQKIEVSPCPSCPDVPKEQWLADPVNQNLMDKSLITLQKLVKNGFAEDMEINL